MSKVFWTSQVYRSKLCVSCDRKTFATKIVSMVQHEEVSDNFLCIHKEQKGPEIKFHSARWNCLRLDLECESFEVIVLR